MTPFLLAAAILATLAVLAQRRGAWPERAVAWAMLAGLAIAPLIQFHPTLGRHDHFGLFIVDFGLLTVVLGVALRSDRWWPLFSSAFVLLATVTGLVLAFNTGLAETDVVGGPRLWNALAACALAWGLASRILRSFPRR